MYLLVHLSNTGDSLLHIMQLKHVFFTTFGWGRTLTTIWWAKQHHQWARLGQVWTIPSDACVSNIGLVRLADNHWVKQYSGLLCVLNGDGEVLTWKLTKSLLFASMEDILCALRDRFKRQGKNLEEFFIDNCCTLRSKLKSVFGEHLRVYWIFSMHYRGFQLKYLRNIPIRKNAWEIFG